MESKNELLICDTCGSTDFIKIQQIPIATFPIMTDAFLKCAHCNKFTGDAELRERVTAQSADEES